MATAKRAAMRQAKAVEDLQAKLERIESKLDALLEGWARVEVHDPAPAPEPKAEEPEPKPATKRK